MQQEVESFRPSQITATANITAGAVPGKFYGGLIFVSAASNTPTITIYDDVATGTGTKVVDTFTPTAGNWYRMPFIFNSGIYVVLGGTVSCTVGWQPA